MREDFIEVYEGFLSKFGEKSQRYQCIEEMSELIKELCKLDRYIGTDKESIVVENIKEEIADVLNMVEQLEYIDLDLVDLEIVDMDWTFSFFFFSILFYF